LSTVKQFQELTVYFTKIFWIVRGVKPVKEETKLDLTRLLKLRKNWKTLENTRKWNKSRIELQDWHTIVLNIAKQVCAVLYWEQKRPLLQMHWMTRTFSSNMETLTCVVWLLLQLHSCPGHCGFLKHCVFEGHHDDESFQPDLMY